MPEDLTDPVLVLVGDLIFASKIRATAHAQNARVQMMSDPAQLADATGVRLIVDLNQAGVIEPSAEWGKLTGREVVGFVSHMDSPTIVAARQAGITQVLARSRFVEILPDLLR